MHRELHEFKYYFEIKFSYIHRRQNKKLHSHFHIIITEYLQVIKGHKNLISIHKKS